MAAETLQQIKDAYKGVTNIFHATFAIRDYLLYRIYEAVYSSGTEGGIQESLSSVTWDSNVINTIVQAGARVVTFETNADFTGTINGTTRLPNRAYTFRANYNNTLPDIVVIVSTGSVNVDVQN